MRIITRRPIRLLLFLLWSLAAAAIAWRFAGRATDDVYITYRYAQNLAAGDGFVFNPGERVLGVTDPGVALLLAGLTAATGIPLPLLGTLLAAAALLAIAALLLAEGEAAGRWPEAAAGGTLVVTSAFLWTGQGSGPIVALALLLAAARALDRRQASNGRSAAAPAGRLTGFPAGASAEIPAGVAARVLAGVLAGLAFWCRPDAALGGILLGLLAWSARRLPTLAPGGPGALAPSEPRRPPWAYAAALAATALAGVAAAAWYFGTAVPNTLSAKRQYAALAPELHTGLGGFWRQAWGSFGRLDGERLALALGLLGLAGLWPLFRRSGLAGRLLVLHAAGLAVAYTLLRVPFFIWYVAPEMVALLYGACYAAGAVVRALARRSRSLPAVAPRLPVPPVPQPGGLVRGPVSGTSGADQPGDRTLPTRARLGSLARPAAAIALALCLAAGALSVAATWRWWEGGAAGDWRLPAYRAVGLWIHDHSAPTDRVAFTEIGILAYHSRRPILDLIGLVSPETLPYAAQGDLVGAFLARPTELVVFHTFHRRGGTRPILEQPWFPAAYAEAVRFDLPTHGGSILVFRRRPGAPIPPPRPPHPRPTASASWSAREPSAARRHGLVGSGAGRSRSAL